MTIELEPIMVSIATGEHSAEEVEEAEAAAAEVEEAEAAAAAVHAAEAAEAAAMVAAAEEKVQQEMADVARASAVKKRRSVLLATKGLSCSLQARPSSVIS